MYCSGGIGGEGKKMLPRASNYGDCKVLLAKVQPSDFPLQVSHLIIAEFPNFSPLHKSCTIGDPLALTTS